MGSVNTESKRGIHLHLGSREGPAVRRALQELADRVVDDDQAGQRGRTLSPLMQRLARAYRASPDRTVRLLRQALAAAGRNRSPRRRRAT